MTGAKRGPKPGPKARVNSGVRPCGGRVMRIVSRGQSLVDGSEYVDLLYRRRENGQMRTSQLRYDIDEVTLLPEVK
jgi:hypothetical protein